MKRVSVPKPLHDVLGDEGSAALVEVLNRQQDQMTDDIARAIIKALEPRFASIEARLDRCATKEDLAGFATKADLAGFATQAAVDRLAEKTQTPFDRLAEKQEAFAVALERGLGGIRAELRGFATQAAVDRLGENTQASFDRHAERQEAFAVALERGLGGIRADMAGQRADMLKWMFLFWVGQAFVVLAYLRAAE